MSQFNKYLEIVQEEKYEYNEGIGSFFKGKVFNKKQVQPKSESDESKQNELLTQDNINKWNNLVNDFISRCKEDKVKKYVTKNNPEEKKSISDIIQFSNQNTLKSYFLYDSKLERVDKHTNCYRGDLDLLLAVLNKQPLKKIYEIYVSKGGQKNTSFSNLINDLRNHEDFNFSFGTHSI